MARLPKLAATIALMNIIEVSAIESILFTILTPSFLWSLFVLCLYSILNMLQNIVCKSVGAVNKWHMSAVGIFKEF